MESDPLQASLRATVERWTMFEAGQTVLVAVSGGPDSTALLHALVTLREEWNLRLIAAHLHHGLRGAEADADANHVVALGAALGVEVRVGHADVPAIRRRRGGSKQTVAREVRHTWLRRTAAESASARIALGHTRDDRVETILLNLLRGTGPEGLAGFPATELPLVRPLYDTTRSMVESYCATNALTVRTDASNSDLDCLRNRTRAELLPYLMSYYNSRADRALLRLADLVVADNDVLDQIACTLLSRLDVGGSSDVVKLGRQELDAAPLALRRRVLRQAIVRLRGHLTGVTFHMIETVLADAGSGIKQCVTLPSSGECAVRILGDRDTIQIVRDVPAASAIPWQVELNTPGCTRLDAVGISIEIALCSDRGDLEAFRHRARPMPGRAHWFVLRGDDVVTPLIARSWRPGDRIRRRAGHRKVQDLFVDAHVPAAQRASVAVVTDQQGRLLAVVGFELADTGFAFMTEAPASGWLAVAVCSCDG